ncbi:MAG: energy-coupling factor transporter transmembrane protein EcfT [Lachnospiraceae bacterium]|nr:energy-coupling factor transporter transmembrane protein EcfT [Lachnospiraceae bacterium]
MDRMISYMEKDTVIHRLSGFTKLLFFIIWCIAGALTYDTRVLVVMLFMGAVIYLVSKTEWKQVSAVFKAIIVFMILNLVFIFFFSPYEGCRIYGSTTPTGLNIGSIVVTREQLFYELNVMMKYFTVIPAVFIFLTTTDPSEFAASINMVGVPYTFAYSVAIALRYIPDVQDDFTRIKNAQEARGIEMSGKAGITDRIKRIASIIFPLLFSTMDRIDVVSDAMELRGFGKKKRRTWYSYRALSLSDKCVITFIVLFFAAAMVFTFYDGNRFWYPWV